MEPNTEEIDSSIILIDLLMAAKIHSILFLKTPPPNKVRNNLFS